MSAYVDERAFAPTGNVSEYGPPRGALDRDPAKPWLRRALPLVRSHRLTLGTALAASFVSLMLQAVIPQLLDDAITNSLQTHRVPLSHYTTLVFVLSALIGVSAFISSIFLNRTAFAIEFSRSYGTFPVSIWKNTHPSA